MIMTGKVFNILAFGAQVELGPNKKGLIHISKLADSRVGKVEDVVKLGDEVTVKVIKVDERDGKIDLSMRPSDINGTWIPKEDDDERGGRGDRGGRGRGDRGGRDRGRGRR
jgi:predicted RNA-binding protein with RPS1 domain